MKSLSKMHGRIGALILAVLTTLTAGCGSSGSGSGGSSSASSMPLVVANSVMRDQGATLASPVSGGMIADLYIQPRASMLAPDTTIVGCDQAGSGALGIQSYLDNPAWITQQILFTDLYIPARNFASGFPLSDGSGGTLPVRSYFVTDIKGSFHLAAGDQAGYYQFSVIADDSAQIRTSVEGTFDYLLVDNEKPAGPNGGCLEQTQTAHLGCSSQYANQSGQFIHTIHIAPGESIPLEVLYWQGPGLALAMTVLYRQVADPTNTTSLQDASCGQELGFTEGSAGLLDLLTRWTPVTFNNLSAL
jgi:hypothetical protein